MPSQDDVQAQQDLLTQYRRTLNVLLGQRAAIGKDFAQPGVVNGIEEARFHIRQIKATLRSWDVLVEDLPYDEELTAPVPLVTPTLPPSARPARDSSRKSPISLIVGGIIVLVVAFLGLRSLGGGSQSPNQVTPAMVATATPAAPVATELSATEPAARPTVNSAPASPPEATATSTTAGTGTFDIGEALQSTTPDFETKLLQIRVLPTGVMEWKLELWNKTGAPQTVYMANGSYVVDDIGNKYDIVQGLGATVQAGERSEQTITFKAPKPGGSAFSLYVNSSIGVQYTKPAVAFSKVLNSDLAVEPTQKPADKNTFQINEPVPNSVTDFEMKLTTLQLLPGNVLRVSFDVWNKSGQGQTVYMANGSYLIDDQGNKYEIIDGMGVTFQAGERSQQSITFHAPKTMGTTYSLYINNSIGVQFSNPAVAFTVTPK